MRVVPIAVAIALASTLTAQTTGRKDLGGVGDFLGQTVTADRRYTSHTSDLGVDLIDLATGNRTLIAGAKPSSKRLRFPAYASAISPDGKLIAFQRTNGPRSELVLIDNQGRGEQVLLQGDGIQFLPTDWSPDGGVLLVVKRGVHGSSACAITLPSGGRPIIVENPDGAEIGNARFSPDASWIACTVSAESATNASIREAKLFFAPVSRTRQPVDMHDAAIDLAGWLPGTMAIVFARKGSGGPELATYDVAKKQLGPALGSFGTGGFNQLLGVSKDEQLFYTDTRRATAIHEFDIPSGNGKSILSGAGRYQSPAWSPDGKELFYVYVPENAVGRELQLFLHNRSTGENSRLAVVNKPISRSASWTPDGKSILLPVTSERPHVERLDVLTRAFETFFGATASEGATASSTANHTGIQYSDCKGRKLKGTSLTVSLQNCILP
jgi:hypothetical protein